MIYKILFSDEAHLDLRGIYNYLKYQFKASNTADNILIDLKQGIRSLSQFPEIFQRIEDNGYLNHNVRLLPVKKYVVIYLVNNEESTVTILRIFHSRQNIRHQLFGD